MWRASAINRKDILEQNVDESDNEEDDVIQNSKQEVITVKCHLGSTRKRRHKAVLRGKSFKLAADSEKYFHSRFILYLPWYSESALLVTFDTYAEHYHNMEDLVEHNAHYFNQHSEDMDLAINLIADNSPPEMILDSIAPTIENGNTVSEEFFN